MKNVKLFDTTLRDGSQGERVSFTLEDKLTIARKLDAFGMDYIEGGWPGSNPKDMKFFEQAGKINWNHAKIVAFGSTRRTGVSVHRDQNIRMLIEADTSAVSIFGKSWIMHATVALKVDPEENLNMIYESVHFLKQHGREVIYDAEHFFDGYKDNAQYALRTLEQAVRAGADVLVLCDTNGGTLPDEIYSITSVVRDKFDTQVGIHAHNDGDLAVANTLAAVRAGATHIQGTINGFGERCGNANLISVIPNLTFKMGTQSSVTKNIHALTDLSNFVYEVANIAPRTEAAFVGKSAFAHKGGIHVSAVLKNPQTYEHLDPEKVGNSRRVLVSDLAGRSNVQYKMKELQIKSLDPEVATKVVQEIKHLEDQGYSFESAEASFELLVEKHRGSTPFFFELEGFRAFTEKDGEQSPRSEASIRVVVQEREEHTAAEGDGPVNALDNALRKALMRFYPEIALVHLVDYKVRVLNEAGKTGTASKVRVLIQTRYQNDQWTTIGVSENIIEASWQALVDSYNFFLLKKYQRVEKEEKKNEEKNIHI
ncbi:MAG: citramalate synthase [Calditrichia bacterium]